jgi:hypothetical protein
MDRETFTETIRAFKNRAPFRPFTVVTVSGNKYEIDHSDALAVNDGVALFAGPGGVPVIFDFEGVSEVIGDLSGHGAQA